MDSNFQNLEIIIKTWQFILGIICLAIAAILFLFMQGSESLRAGIVLTVIGIVFIAISRRQEKIKDE